MAGTRAFGQPVGMTALSLAARVRCTACVAQPGNCVRRVSAIPNAALSQSSDSRCTREGNLV